MNNKEQILWDFSGESNRRKALSEYTERYPGLAAELRQWSSELDAFDTEWAAIEADDSPPTAEERAATERAWREFLRVIESEGRGQ